MVTAYKITYLSFTGDYLDALFGLQNFSMNRKVAKRPDILKLFEGLGIESKNPRIQE